MSKLYTALRKTDIKTEGKIYMEINVAKELVVEAGKKLVAKGLIARTWGNVSCRISDTHFCITPSGRAYENLAPEEIVVLNIADCSYEGNIKPSSEKGIHASVYELKPDINFVIHTHQLNASVVSALGLDINKVEAGSAAVIGDHVPNASYGLPGTKKLKKGVRAALERSDSKAVVMANHGALCMGADFDESFAVAAELEKVCEKFIFDRYSALTGSIAESFLSVGEYVNSLFQKGKSIAEFPACDSEREGDMLKLIPKDGGAPVRMDIKSGKFSVAEGEQPVSAELHRQIYAKRKDVNCVIHSKNAETLAVSKAGYVLKPLLDDFAQLIGATMNIADFDPNNTIKSSKKTVKKLKGRSAVLLKNNGAICVASDMYDAEAIQMVVEKGARTYFGAALFGRIKPINPVETRLMRFIYNQKYSKRK